jgi:predicted ester cyclase
MPQQVATHHEALIRELFSKVFHEGNIQAADQYNVNDVELNFLHKRLTSLAEWKQMAQALRNAFPDLHYELYDFVVEGDKVAFRWEARGTHKGELWGLPASNKKLVWHGLSLYRMRGNKIGKGWTYSNFAEIYGSLSS